jgi:tetratricopeptide (TPR) repeat protein
LKIPGLLAIYFKAHGEYGLAIRLCERGLSCAVSDRSPERALALLCRGMIIVYGNQVAADRPLLEAVSIAREVGDEWTEAYACGALAQWLIHIGETQAAVCHLTRIERLAETRGDDLLRGLAGVARSWLYLADGDIGKALDVLRSVRSLSADFHQHHFIGMYLGLGLFRLGDLAQAAAEWHEAMQNAIAVGHLRGIAGSVEGCAYLAERLGHHQESCRFLGAAEQMRQRAGSPLFCFWIRHNEAARAALRSTLGASRYDAAVTAGARMHVEDGMNEAAELLRQFAAGLSAR